MIRKKFTGERYVPGEGGAQIAYEHWHRYVFAKRWAVGRNVLDVGCGTGYGTALLSGVARLCWGIELDRETAREASKLASAENLCVLQADVGKLPLATASMDIVVAFEILEHVEDYQSLMQELARVLSPDGTLLISTPNKASYSDHRQYRNPYHIKEFYRDEFLALLHRYFPEVLLCHQQIRSGSLIIEDSQTDKPGRDPASGPSAVQEGEVLVDSIQDGQATEPMYFLALCRSGPDRNEGPRVSCFLDTSDSLIQEWAAESTRLNAEISSLGRWGRELEGEVAARDGRLRSVLDEIEARDDTIRSMQAEMVQEIQKRDRSLALLREEFEERSEWAHTLQERVENRDQILAGTQRELDRTADHLARIRHFWLYRVLCRLGILPK